MNAAMIWADVSPYVVSLNLDTFVGAGDILAGKNNGFDLKNFFTNARTYFELVVTAFIGLLGVIAIAVGATKFVLRIIGDPQEAKRKHTWSQIILCLLGGGALIGVAAWAMIQNIAKAGAGTVEELGKGSIDVEPLLSMLTMF